MPAAAPTQPRQLEPVVTQHEGTPDGARTPDLLPQVYDELKEVAQRCLAHEPPGLTLQATALVHEAYMRLGGEHGKWENRRHFFGAAAIAMRRILVERARAKAGPKRGGGRLRLSLDQDASAPTADPAEILSLDEALSALQATDAQLAEIVSLRYFAGLSIDQTAEALGMSPRSVDRAWKAARAFLRHHLGSGGSGAGEA
jgi:RNA polymerase sigma factor (TIGR02999 family)